MTLSELTRAAAEENRFVTSATWEEYLKFLEAVGDRPIRVTYDRGRLEIMSPTLRHEQVKTWLATLLEGLMMEKGIDYLPGGATTFRRQDLERGLEPDECYWITNFSKLVPLEAIDLTRDPPPDLVLEIDVSRSSIDRIELFRVLKVPEVWRHVGQGRLEVRVLQTDGSYAVGTTSRLFPGLAMEVVTAHLEMAAESSITRATLAFRTWVREHL